MFDFAERLCTLCFTRETSAAPVTIKLVSADVRYIAQLHRATPSTTNPCRHESQNPILQQGSRDLHSASRHQYFHV